MNLKTLAEEKLLSLPYKQGIKTTLNGKGNSVTICGWDCHNSYWNNETCRKIRHILENSAGQHIDDIHSKVSKMNHIYPYSTEDVIAMFIKGDERNKYFNINKIYYGRLYINKDGIITKRLNKPYNTCKSNARRKQQLAEIKYKKQRDKIINDTLLKIINKKLLFEFYVKLLSEEKVLKEQLIKQNEYLKKNRKKVFNSRWWDTIWMHTHSENINEYSNKLVIVQNSISKIENGETLNFIKID